MTKYYLLRRDSDPSVLGVDNGIKQAEILRRGFRDPEKFDYLKEVLGSPKYWLNKDRISGFDFNIECVQLLPNAKITHFIQYGPALINCPFLISKRVADILGDYKIPDGKLFPATVFDLGGGENSYFLAHFSRLSDSMIDFGRSSFFVGNYITGREMHVFSSAEDKEVFNKKNAGLKSELICFNRLFDPALDLFVMSDGEMVISESLKNALGENHCLSGVNVLPAFGSELKWAKINC